MIENILAMIIYTDYSMTNWLFCWSCWSLKHCADFFLSLEMLQMRCEAQGLCYWLTSMQMHFKKCTLVLKPEVTCFAYKTVVFSLPHQHIEIARVHLTFFEWFLHQSLQRKGHKKSHAVGWPWWFISPDLPLSPTCSSSCISISLNDVHSPTWPKRKPWVPLWPLSLLTDHL